MPITVHVVYSVCCQEFNQAGLHSGVGSGIYLCIMLLLAPIVCRTALDLMMEELRTLSNTLINLNINLYLLSG